MKITTTYQQETQVDIELPFIRMSDGDGIQECFALLNESTYVKIFVANLQITKVISIRSTTPDKADFNELLKVKDWPQMSEPDFLEFHAGLLSRLSLQPILNEKTDPDDIPVGVFERSGIDGDKAFRYRDEP